MLNSLKKIVIILAILIVSLIIIILFTIFKKLNFETKDNLLDPNIFKVEENYNVNSLSIDDGKLFLYLESNDSNILRIYDLNNGKKINDYYLR